MFHRLLCACWLFAGLFGLSAAVPTGEFTAQISGVSTPAPPTLLVRHANNWQYRLGTNAPQSDWKATNAVLDATWLTGPGGFGYDDGDDATVLNTMSNNFTTVYIRQAFTIGATPNTNVQLRLTMDWDDGFIAWLDGNEIARSTNAPGAVGTEPAYNAISLAPNHEASAGQGGNPPTVYNLGRAADHLGPGTHVLAVMGLNGATNSSDFSLIADLDMFDASSTGPGPLLGQYFDLVATNVITLSGSNTWPNAVRVTVNGEEAINKMGEQTWFKPQTLTPGMNRLFIAALDSSGAIVASINKDIIYESSTTFAGGTQAVNTAWTSGVVRVTSDVIVPAGVTLSLSPGVVVLLPRTNLITSRGGVIDVAGSEDRPAFFLPADGTTAWRELSANGINAILNLRHAEILAGQVRALNGGSVLIEDSVSRELLDPTREIIAAVNGNSLVVRRCHISGYSEVDSRETSVLIEHSLFENFLVDGLDIKATNAPLVVRDTTLRHGDPTNLNADALDFGPGAATVERCLIHHFPDKGVSIGGAPGTRVSGSVIYNCGIGISAYSSTGIVLVNNTVSACGDGVLFRDNPQPAVGNATNLIVWGNTNNVVITNTSSLTITYSDTQGAVLPGAGNISADPLFTDPLLSDYHLNLGSPARNAGLGGVDMGAIFPVGGIPSAPAMLAALPSVGAIRLTWQEDADNEQSFGIERSPDGSTWSVFVSAPANSTEFLDTNVFAGTRYFYRVAAVNGSGKSHYSNITSGTPNAAPVIETFVGGTLTSNTTWSANMGTIIVLSNIIVPTNIVLTMTEGTTVKMTNGVAIRATAGGVINVVGTKAQPVTISRWTPGVWTELSANGTNASLYVSHADISGGQTTVYFGATGLVEDSYIHDYRISGTILTQPIVLCHFAKFMHMRRCHVKTYYETLWRNGVILIEDSLFEDISGDGVDFDAAQSGTILRRCSFRHGDLGNVDAVDVGPADLGGSRDVLITDCIMFDFPFDKGVSIGDGGQGSGTIVSNCLMYGCLSGVMVKDSLTGFVYNCTIVDNSAGFTNYNKVNPSSPTGGGHTIAANNILWDNRITIAMANSGTVTAAWCDLQHTNWPGLGNIDVDPLFLDPAARDYRLATNSPCIGAGSNGVTMGVTFPVGGVPAEPRNLHVVTNDNSQVLLGWTDASDNESGFLVEASTNSVNWTVIANAPPDTNRVLVSTSYGIYFRVRATNFIDASFASNIASITGPPDDFDGDGMPDSWELTYGFNPGNPLDASQDADGDGLSNLDEYRAGTNPRLASSRLGFNSVQSVGANQVELTFTVQPDKSYAVEFRNSLSSGTWTPLINVPAGGSSYEYTFTETLPPGTRTRFYRLVIP
jgi:parallel beta-helix repeat protein